MQNNQMPVVIPADKSYTNLGDCIFEYAVHHQCMSLTLNIVLQVNYAGRHDGATVTLAVSAPLRSSQSAAHCKAVHVCQRV